MFYAFEKKIHLTFIVKSQATYISEKNHALSKMVSFKLRCFIKTKS